MAKLTLTDITSGYQLATAYNANNTLIEAALENTLSRDGTSPNSMGADLDMNSWKIINLADPVNDLDGVNKQYLDAQIAGVEGLSDLSSLTNDANPAVDDIFVFEDISENLPNGITFAQLVTAIEGQLNFLGIAGLVDPNADRILFWDDSAGAIDWLSFTNGLEFSGTTVNVRLLSTGGLAFTTGQIGIDLTGCTADATIGGTDLLLIDDGTAKKVTWTNFINNIELGVTHDNLQGVAADEHVAHSGVTLTAGTGLSGGGTIALSRTFNLDISGLTALSGTDVAATDGYLVDDGGVMKRIAHQSAGVPVLTDATTSWTLTDADMNSYLIATNAGAITVTLNTGVGEKGNVILIEQGGAGQITVSGTATINNANGTKTTAQKSVICLVSTATDVWTLFGDATT